MSEVYEIADRYVLAYAALDPIAATDAGIAGHDHELTDYSPEADAARDRLDRDTLAALDARAASRRPRPDRRRRDDRAAPARGRVARRRRGAPRGADHRQPGAGDPQCFDLMAYDSEHDWEVAAQRLDARARNRSRASRPRCAKACDAGSSRPGARRSGARSRPRPGAASADATPFFVALVGEARRRPDAARASSSGQRPRPPTRTRELAAFLRDEYAPKADPRDPVGRERYALFARSFNGIELDLDETYAWGWEELYRIEERMRDGRASASCPARRVVAVGDHLDHDATRTIEGVDEFRQWNQDLIDRTISELDGTHFDIAPPLRRCEAMIAPPGGAAAMYYTGPSEDFSRPGRTWYPTQGRTTFPLWREVSTCYHEGVPGHHLQVAQVKYLSEQLSRFQRAFGFLSGHGEGWALYAERLMGELGYLEDPAYELGMLGAQAMRAVRVIVDIGMHLELPIPPASATTRARRGRGELALPFVIERSCEPEHFMRSEVDRYLGWPGQAISYKVGERVWLEARADAQRRHGAAFDLKEFHSYALDLGGMGLGPLRDELARF